MSAGPKPGDTVVFNLPFTGVVAKVRGRYAVIRTATGEHNVFLGDVIQVVNPRPPADQVITVPCPRCEVKADVMCIHLQTGETLKHPHLQRDEVFLAG